MDSLGQWAYDLAESILSILPDSPFQFLTELTNNQLGEWIAWVNWFIPINTMITIFSTWCSAILVYYVYQVGLRWGKFIQ